LKTETSNRTELVRRALQMGLLLDQRVSPVSSAYQLASAPPFQMNPAAEMAVGDGAGSDDAGDKPPPTGTAADAT